MLIEAFGPDRAVGMATILSGQSDPDGRINVRSLGMTYLGEFAGAGSPRVAAAPAALNQAGIPATAAEDITAALEAGALPVGAEAGLPLTWFPLEKTASAHDAVESGATGKVLIRVADDLI